MKNRRKQIAGKIFIFKCGHKGRLPEGSGEHNKFAIWHKRDGDSSGWGCRKCAYRKTLEWRKKNIKSYLFSNAKNRSKISGIQFSIKLSDVPDIPKTCPIFPWLRLRSGLGEGWAASPNAPSIDRINSVKGYVRGNIRIISRRANLLKNNMTTKELKALLAASKHQ